MRRFRPVSAKGDDMWVLSHSVTSSSLRPHGLCDSPGKNTGVGCHALLQGIFPAQGSNPGLPHCGQIPYCLSHQGRKMRGLSNAVTMVVAG